MCISLIVAFCSECLIHWVCPACQSSGKKTYEDSDIRVSPANRDNSLPSPGNSGSEKGTTPGSACPWGLASYFDPSRWGLVDGGLGRSAGSVAPPRIGATRLMGRPRRDLTTGVLGIPSYRAGVCGQIEGALNSNANLCAGRRRPSVGGVGRPEGRLSTHGPCSHRRTWPFIARNGRQWRGEALLAAPLCVPRRQIWEKGDCRADPSGERSNACWVMLEGRSFGGG